MSIADLAKRLGMSRLDGERALAGAIVLGSLPGVVDRTTHEFVLNGAEARQAFIGKCPQCGGDVKKWTFPEERVVCPDCTFAISAPMGTGTAPSASP